MKKSQKIPPKRYSWYLSEPSKYSKTWLIDTLKYANDICLYIKNDVGVTRHNITRQTTRKCPPTIKDTAEKFAAFDAKSNAWILIDFNSVTKIESYSEVF